MCRYRRLVNIQLTRLGPTWGHAKSLSWLKLLDQIVEAGRGVFLDPQNGMFWPTVTVTCWHQVFSLPPAQIDQKRKKYRLLILIETTFITKIPDLLFFYIKGFNNCFQFSNVTMFILSRVEDCPNSPAHYVKYLYIYIYLYICYIIEMLFLQYVVMIMMWTQNKSIGTQKARCFWSLWLPSKIAASLFILGVSSHRRYRGPLSC